MLSRRYTRRAVLAAAVLAVVGVRPVGVARGSGVAAPKDVRAEADAETIVIVWDPATKTEHLILSALLPSGAALLVPTPAEPKIDAGGQDAIDALSKLTAPRTDVKTKTVTPEFGWPRLDGWGTWGAGPVAPTPSPKPAAAEPPAAATVSVPTGDPAKLAEWMTQNGYDAKPALTDWLKGYADKKWTVTAIKPAETAGGSVPPVRLTFQTDKPVFPYREPTAPAADGAAAPNRARLLRVYVVADGRYDGTVGDSATWPAKTVYAGKAEAKDVGAAVKGAAAPGGGWWVTEFEDMSAPRPATDDVAFKKAADQASVERAPNEVYLVNEMPPAWAVNAAILAGLVLLAVVVVSRRRRKPAAVTTTTPPAGPTEPDLL